MAHWKSIRRNKYQYLANESHIKRANFSNWIATTQSNYARIKGKRKSEISMYWNLMSNIIPYHKNIHKFAICNISSLLIKSRIDWT